jgi:hypothetical protein
MLLLLGFLLVLLLSVILLLTLVLIGLEGVIHVSNLDFSLLRDPTVLPYPLSYSESESLESLSSWRRFFFRDLFWAFFTVFSSFEKRSMICAKELALSFLPLPWRFCPTAAFLLKLFLRVTSFLYLRHSPVLWVVCAPPCFWHSAQLFSALTFLGTRTSWEPVPLRLPLSRFPVAFSELSLAAFSLASEFATTFLTFSRTPSSFLTPWGSESYVRSY